MNLIINKNFKTQAVFIAAVALFLWICASAQAEPSKPAIEEDSKSIEIMLGIPDLTADQIRDSLKAELRAFRKQDAKAAYFHASDHARTKYKTPKQFFRMMRNACHMLSDHLSYTFLEQSRMGKVVFQKIQFTGANGIPTKSIFRLIRDEGGKWRTDSCITFETDALAV